MTSAASGEVVPRPGDLLQGAAAAVPFAEAVAAQLFGTSGGYRDAASATRAHLLRRLANLLLRARTAPPGDDCAYELLRDPALASSIFQNLDLLYQHGFEGADSVGSTLLRAIELIGEEPGGSGPE